MKQEQSPELPVDPLAVSSAMAAAAMATPPLLGLSPISRLPIPHQVSLETLTGAEGGRQRGVTPDILDSPPPAGLHELGTLGAEGPLPPTLTTSPPSSREHKQRKLSGHQSGLRLVSKSRTSETGVPQGTSFSFRFQDLEKDQHVNAKKK